MKLPKINPSDVDCPCGKTAVSVTPLTVPHTNNIPGDCMIEPERAAHYSLAVHPRYRPDVVAVRHGGD